MSRSRLSRLGAVAAFAVALALPGGAAADRSVYVTNGASQATGLAAFDAAGGPLSPLPGTPVATGDSPVGVLVSPDARTAYVANFLGDSVSTYTLGTSGVPTELGTAVAAGDGPSGLGVTPDGKYLYVSNRGTPPRIAAFAIDPNDGSLTAIASSPIDLGVFDPRAVVVSPDGRFLYVTARRGPEGPPATNAEQAVAVASIGADGSLTPISGSPFYGLNTLNGFGASIAPDGSRLFIAASGADKIEVFDLNPTTGAPTEVAGSPFATGDAPLVLSLMPDGASLYVAESFGTAVEGFDINPASGALTQIAGTPATTAGQPNGLAITPDAEQVYASISSDPGQVEGFNVAAGGSLSSVTGSPFPSGGTFPDFFSVAVTPTQTPVVDFDAVRGPARSKTSFDASATAVRGGLPTRFDWDFGDGTTLPDGGAMPAHTYGTPGTYVVSLTVTNDCDPAAHFTGDVATVGNTVYCNGPPQATLTDQVKIRPPDKKVDGNAKAKKKQRQKGKAIVVKVKVKAGEVLTARISGKINAGDHSFKLRAASKKVDADEKRVLKLKPKSKHSSHRIQKALGSEGKAKAKLRARLTDKAGNEKTQKLKVTLKG